MRSFSDQMCRAGRALLKWSAKDLAREAGIGIATIQRFEAGGDALQSSVDAMRAAMEKAGLAFIGPGQRSEGGGGGVRASE